MVFSCLIRKKKPSNATGTRIARSIVFRAILFIVWPKMLRVNYGSVRKMAVFRYWISGTTNFTLIVMMKWIITASTETRFMGYAGTGWEICGLAPSAGALTY